MTIATKRAGLIAAVAALIGAAACSNKSQPIDDSLKADLAAVGGSSGNNDLQLAPSGVKSQVVVSALEGGPKAAPAPAAPKRTPQPLPRPATRVAQKQTPAPAPTQPEPVTQAPAPEPTPAPVAPAPAPAPRQDHRVYKTEGEIFRQMPWIRP